MGETGTVYNYTMHKKKRGEDHDLKNTYRIVDPFSAAGHPY
jgi:hypothetical protein